LCLVAPADLQTWTASAKQDQAGDILETARVLVSTQHGNNYALCTGVFTLTILDHSSAKKGWLKAIPAFYGLAFMETPVTHYGGPDALQVLEENCSEPKAGEVRVRDFRLLKRACNRLKHPPGVLRCRDGLEAKRLLEAISHDRRTHPALILSDWHVPRCGGLNCCDG
jgi:hypothetical protein